MWKRAAITHVRYEVDGCARVAMRLDACDAPVRALALKIPLVESEAPFMQVITDELRIHYSGVVPPGTGEVYNTKAAPRRCALLNR